MNGKCKFFVSGKGFGFITGEDGKDYFVHITNVKNNQILKEGELVSFEESENERGLKAVNVEVIKEE